ncbi:hypothetical protein [Priestia megaterium]|uniref:hypothetical protein n=1 Tax=Priestia megaterium TaxID=1404 RepID=UPI003FD2A3E4
MNSKPNSHELLNGHGIIITNLVPEPESQSYAVYIANQSDYLITKARKKDGAGGSIIPPVGKNCDEAGEDGCNTCYAEKKYDQVFSCGCDDAPFELELYFKHPTNGREGWGTETFPITPSCDRVGIVHCILGINFK